MCLHGLSKVSNFHLHFLHYPHRISMAKQVVSSDAIPVENVFAFDILVKRPLAGVAVPQSSQHLERKRSDKCNVRPRCVQSKCDFTPAISTCFQPCTQKQALVARAFRRQKVFRNATRMVRGECKTFECQPLTNSLPQARCLPTARSSARLFSRSGK